MARDFNGSSDHLSGSFVPISAFPFTLAAWFHADNTTSSKFFFGMGDTGSNTYYQSLIAYSDATVIMSSRGGSGPKNAATTTTYGTTNWHHACGVVSSPDSRSVFLDGGGKGTAPGNAVLLSFDTTFIGRLTRLSPTAYFDGRIAEAAIWDVALTDAEVALLAKAVSPLMVRPQSIVGYWPLIGKSGPEIDLVGANGLPVTGATAAPHPRIYYPDRPQIIVPGSAGAPAPSFNAARTGRTVVPQSIPGIG